MTQAGDKCDFIGTLIVVPDVSQIQTMGATAETSTRVKGGEAGDSEGVRWIRIKIVVIKLRIKMVVVRIGINL